MHINAILISILKYCFIVELSEKWRSVLPPPPVARLIWATHLGVLACARPCAAHTRLFGLINTVNWALRVPPPIIVPLLLSTSHVTVARSMSPARLKIKRKNL